MTQTAQVLAMLKMKAKKNKVLLYLILFSFLSIKLFHLLIQKGISWDSAVYIGMGKYIFSLGKIGLWEPARPIITPIYLGFIWKIGLNPILWGSIIGIAFGLGCIYLTYLIGKSIFNEKIAALSAFFLAFSPVFLFYSSTPMTEIPALFLSLLAVYLAIRKKYFLAGLLISLSAMTRFLQLFIMIPIWLIIIGNNDNLKHIINQAKSFIFGLSIPFIPYLALNIFLYSNPVYPFLLQAFMTKYTGWIFHQPLNFYFVSLIKENFISIFVLIGIPLALMKPNGKKIIILSAFLLFFAFFSSIAHKETRFMLTFLPYIYIIASVGLFAVVNLVKKEKRLFYLVIFLISAAWLVREIPQIEAPLYKEFPEFQEYTGNDAIKENIWISNPIFIADSGKKADELIYYPLYNSKKIDELADKLPKADNILINTCDILPCPPDDLDCEEKTKKILDSIKKDFKNIYSKKEQSCECLIFQKVIS